VTLSLVDPRVLVGLAREQYDAVILIGLGGWTYERVARATHVPIGTVLSRLSRGRQKLKLPA
jgi:RNA polymerase sigma-70 factor, ECF subfamily